MGGNYQKGLYKQLMEVLSRVDRLESEQKRNHKEIRSLAGEASSLREENAALREEVSSLKQENAALTEKCVKLESENTLLRNDNERMKRTPNNDSSNSSTPLQRMKKQNPPTRTTAGNQLPGKPGRKKGIKGPGFQKGTWRKKYARGSTRTALRRSGRRAGRTLPGIAWGSTWKQSRRKSAFTRTTRGNTRFLPN